MTLPNPRPTTILQKVLPHRLATILLEQNPSPPQLRPKPANQILKSARSNRITKIKTIHIGLIDPALQGIGHSLGTANGSGMGAGDGQVLEDVLLCPFLILEARDGGGPGIDHGLNAGGTGELEVFVVGELGDVGAGPAAEEGRGAFEVGVLEEVLEFGVCFFVAFVDDDEDAGEKFD